eukprot:3301258-Pleurochrysis_carterae.AAC.1
MDTRSCLRCRKICSESCGACKLQETGQPSRAGAVTQVLRSYPFRTSDIDSEAEVSAKEVDSPCASPCLKRGLGAARGVVFQPTSWALVMGASYLACGGLRASRRPCTTAWTASTHATTKRARGGVRQQSCVVVGVGG